MGAVIDHRLEVAAGLTEQVLADDNESHAGRTHVLLRTAVDETVFLNIYRTAHDIRRHVCNERYGRVDILVYLGTVNGVVGGDVEIIRIRRYLVSLRNVGIVLVLGRGHYLHFAVELRLFGRFLSPYTGLEVSGFLLHEVGRHFEELGGCTAAEEEDCIVVRNIEEVPPKLFGLSHYTFPTRGTVRDFQNTDARVVEITDSLDCGFYRLFRQYARSRVKIVLLHDAKSFNLLVVLRILIPNYRFVLQRYE